MSVGEIKTHEKFDARGVPKEAGLMDPNLGVPPRANYRCKKCHGNDMTCPGHFGHINLVKPVFHCGMLSLLQKLLGCVVCIAGTICFPGTKVQILTLRAASGVSATTVVC
jgi:DNA-directed RNA polymerase II subunit RPB1